jgi:hypothetical protein
MEISLWECLHDAILISTYVDAAQGTASFEFDNWYIRKFHQQSEETTYTFRFEEVSTAHLQSEIVNEADGKLIQGFQAEWCGEQVAWSDFEQRFVADGGRADVFEAELRTLEDGQVEFHSFMHVNDEFYPDLLVRAAHVTVRRSDDVELTVEEFLTLGEAYWEAFAERARTRQLDTPGTQ